ncbi:hypothetical protein RvY_17827 [Ramazzottius varieornatus]|uniref:Large subunit GTPase 1 homolog n=1 Tax=Ramazzottius varieornatus TaxID=947166 RepID=A0A1D1W3J4_RAMVA|nr:hypothetical protein RvY_17827 [Ramazzottius varieornatus]
MPQHGRKQTTLGAAVIKNRFKSNSRAAGQWKSPGEMAKEDNQETNFLKSITAPSDLDEFLANATLAGTEFEAERNNLKLITPNPRAGVLSKSEHSAVLQLQDKHKKLLRIPRRPKWDKSTTPQELDERERKSFLEWRALLSELSNIETLAVTPYEKNLEVWRQMWRVLERSDVVVQIVDARNPLLYWNADLLKYVQEISRNKENLILVNKSDLLAEPQRKIWAEYFCQQGLKAVFFSAIDSMETHSTTESADEVNPQAGHASGAHLEQEGGPQGDDDDWETDEEGSEQEADEKQQGVAAIEEKKEGDTKGFRWSSKIYSRTELVDFLKRMYEGKPTVIKGVTTVGFVGYPNVGKSSTLNALMQHKRVMVSSTPGKTKHFQTMYVDEELMLCDSPGLVMPSFAMSAAEMVVSGILPIDQMRDPLPPVNLICSRISRTDLEKEYGIKLPFIKEYGIDYLITPPPTAEEFLNAYAEMRGFVTARGLPDSSKAARYILKDYVNGRLGYCHAPPGVSQDDFFTSAVANEELIQSTAEDNPSAMPAETAEVPVPSKHVSKSSRVDKEFFAERGAAIHEKRDGLNHVRGPVPATSAGALSHKRHCKHNKKEKLRRIHRDLDVH